MPTKIYSVVCPRFDRAAELTVSYTTLQNLNFAAMYRAIYSKSRFSCSVHKCVSCKPYDELDNVLIEVR